MAERRVCSVLFCDLVGFTPLSESRDLEAVRELLSRYFALAHTVVTRYGGITEKFIGDAVMAVWGAPVAAEGDAERAVRAALDLVAAVEVLGVEAGVAGLVARAGVVTGEVAVTLGVGGEGMAGDAVNTASRVQAVAEPGSVLVDRATQRLVGGAIGFAEGGLHRLKGKAEPERLWRATRVLSAVGGAQRVDGLEAPLIGRDAELRTIRELFHATADRQVPRMVVVSGLAGVGKSRLGWEFEKYIDGLADDVWWHRGRCLSYGDGVAFWALAEIVRQRLAIAEEDPAETAASKLAEGLNRFVSDPGERAYAGARLGRLLGVPFPGDSGASLAREELFAGWRLFFERLAAELPVVLLIEDAQSADAGLLDFLDHLIDWTRELPVYVLVFARPELDQARPRFGTGRNRSTLTLDPLDPASMNKLAEALVPGMPAQVRSKVTAQAQGIPLFAVETIRALIDRDIVQPIEGAYRLVGDVGDLVVPDSLHSLLAARLDALGPDARRLVTDAAVLGTTFPAEALIAVSGQDEAMVRAGLENLVRREVLTVSADPLSPERGSYQFAQQMLRQVAYETLSRRDRKARHLKVAAHLLALGDWDAADDVLTQAADADGLAGVEFLMCFRGWLAALRGDAVDAQVMLAGLEDFRATDDPQTKAFTNTVEAFTAAARDQTQEALRHARAALRHAGTRELSHEFLRWAWPLAARAAFELGETATIDELLALLEDRQPGHLAPMLRAERDLVRARLAGRDGDPDALAAFVSAICGLRQSSTPYHLAHGLLDHAEYRTRLGDAQGAVSAVDEALTIARGMRCRPLLHRAEDIVPAGSPVAPARSQGSNLSI